MSPRRRNLPQSESTPRELDAEMEVGARNGARNRKPNALGGGRRNTGMDAGRHGDKTELLGDIVPYPGRPVGRRPDRVFSTCVGDIVPSTQWGRLPQMFID
jgi:hypothetical protein